MDSKRTKDKTVRTFGNTVVLCLCIVFGTVHMYYDGVPALMSFLCGFFAFDALASIMKYTDEEKEEEHQRMMDMYNH